MADRVVVAGVGMILSPSRERANPTTGWALRRPVWRSTMRAIAYDQVQQAYAGYVYGDSTAGSAPSTRSA